MGRPSRRALLNKVMVGMRKEERDFRSLERESMYSIFAPLDETEPPRRTKRPRKLLANVFVPYLDDTTWTVVLTRLAEDR